MKDYRPKNISPEELAKIPDSVTSIDLSYNRLGNLSKDELSAAFKALPDSIELNDKTLEKPYIKMKR